MKMLLYSVGNQTSIETEKQKDVIFLIFSSVEFLLYFLPVFLLLYGITPDRFKNVTLLAGSLIFYAMGEPKYLFLLLGSVSVNYLFGRFLDVGETRKEQWKREKKHIDYEEWRKGILIFAILCNVGVLLLFKVALRDDALPLGVSFYTFQILSYLIDVYKRRIPGETSFIRLATYVIMFPQLISGPIVTYGEVADALKDRRMTWNSVQSGLKIFTIGLAAKVLLADRIGLLWNDVQVRGFESISTPMAWLGALAYSLKLYFDFCGYSIMAVGLGMVMGFGLPENFRNPYMARSVREFYRRWHITLGRWFCDYVYIPLGGNRRGEWCTARNLLVVWALTGLWHGGRGNFILWGVLLWALIVMERRVSAWMERHPVDGESIWKQMRIFPRLYVWLVIPVTWMCFAITDVKSLGIYLGRMFGAAPSYPAMPGDWRNALHTYGGLFAVCLIGCTPLVRRVYHRWRRSVAMNVMLAALFWVCVWRIMQEGNNPFLYFRF